MVKKSRKKRVQPRSKAAEATVSVARNLLIALAAGIVVVAVASVQTSPSPLESQDSSPVAPRIGIIAGHWQSDSGAVCPDGLREVDINLDIARRVVAGLREKGFRAEVLPEYSRKLDGYQAAAVVSLHADSCVKDASGFKVAAREGRAAEAEDKRLVDCLYEEYAKATGLPRHDRSITEDMTQYHAFRIIAPRTPAAIIEMGFMGGDRELLTQQQDLVAEGIVKGILLFLGQHVGDQSAPE